MLSFVFPRSQLLSVEAADELSLYLQLQEHRGSRRLQAQGCTHYGPHRNLLLRQSLCLRASLGCWAGGSAYHSSSEIQGSQPQAACLPFALQSTAPTFSNGCMADVAFIWFIWGSHKLFQGIIMHGNTAGSGTGKNTCNPGLPMMPWLVLFVFLAPCVLPY